MGLLLASCGAERERLYEDDSSVSVGDDGGRANPGTGLGAGIDGGAGSGDKASPNDVCGDFRIPADTQTPEILIALDRSGSMRMLGVDRWGPSTAAIDSIVQTLEPAVHFGLLMFPGDCTTLTDAGEQLACISRLGGIDQSLSCEPGRLDVTVGAGPAIISSAMQKTAPGGATPTAASIAAASKSLKGHPAHPGEGAKLILLVTDGAPNCSLGVGGLLAVGINSGNGQAEAVAQTVSAIQQADTAGVRTYVIGYNTDSDPFLRSSLDQMAQAGGTGDTTHRKVEDQASLVTTLKDLTQHALLCELLLEQPVTDATRLRVIMGGQPLPAEPVNGYTLGADQRTISLRGSSCEALRASNGTLSAHAQILCPVPPPAPDAGNPTPPGDLPPTLDAGTENPPPVAI